MNMTDEQLRQEAAFADQCYSQYADNVALNPGMFVKYSHPKDMWDWRQYGAKLLGSVAGAKLLDLGCGMGEESVYFAKLGATVTSIDISPVGIELTLRRAEQNGVADKVRALVMRADPTEFPDAAFDVIHGFGILHHIGLDPGLQEVKRLLKPGGRGLFFEHTGNSAFIEYIRNSALVKRMRGRVDYTEYERPLRWDAIVAYRKSFFKLVLKPFHVLTRLRSFNPAFRKDIFKRLDHWLLAVCPPLKHFAGGVVIYLEK